MPILRSAADARAIRERQSPRAALSSQAARSHPVRPTTTAIALSCQIHSASKLAARIAASSSSRGAPLRPGQDSGRDRGAAPAPVAAIRRGQTTAIQPAVNPAVPASSARLTRTQYTASRAARRPSTAAPRRRLLTRRTDLTPRPARRASLTAPRRPHQWPR